MRARPCLALLALALIGGCASAPEPEPVPEPRGAEIVISHDAGAALTGPLAREAPVTTAGDALSVVVRAVLVRAVPTDPTLPPLRPRVVVRWPRPALLAVGELTRGARGGPVLDADASFRRAARGGLGIATVLGRRTTALLRGTTVEVALERPRTGGRPAVRSWLRLHRPALGPLDLVIGARRGDDDEPGLSGELVGLDLSDVASTSSLSWAGLIPWPRPEDGFTDLFLAISAEPAPAYDHDAWPAHEVDVAEARADLARGRAHEEARRERALARAEAARAAPPREASLDDLLAGLLAASTRRRALLEAALATGAPVTADAAMAHDEVALERLAARAHATARDERDPARLGWLLERATLADLAEASAGESPPSEVMALLARHAGALALLPGELMACIESAGSLETWAATLDAENRALLDDGDPVVRVRAHRFLADRDRAPPGYDPLAALEDRRRALAQ